MSGTTRREFLDRMIKASAVTVLGSSTVLQGCNAEIPREKYNILFIGFDDLRPQLNSYGFSQMHTPNFDRLASRSLQYDRAYVQQPVCAASRASFLTGCRPDTTGVNYPYTKWFEKEFLPNHPSVAKFFYNNGYYARTLGKYHHGKDEELSEPAFHARRHFYVKEENIYEPVGRKLAWRDQVQPWEAAEAPDEAYMDGEMVLEAVKTIERATEQDKPFFIAPGFQLPHIPYCCPEQYWELYPPESIDLPDVDSLPEGAPEIALSHSNLSGWGGITDPRNPANEIARTLIRGYYACVSYVDAQIGKLLDALDDNNLTENTVIMLYSDHGFHLESRAIGERGHCSNGLTGLRSIFPFQG